VSRFLTQQLGNCAAGLLVCYCGHWMAAYCAVVPLAQTN